MNIFLFKNNLKGFHGVVGRGANRGFAMLIFVILTSVFLMVLIISYSENQKEIMNTTREVINNEKNFQSSLLCVNKITGMLYKQPNMSQEEFLSLNNYKYMQKNNDVLNETGVCKIIDINKCVDSTCDYRAVISGGLIKNTNELMNGYDEIDRVDEKYLQNRIYVEWIIDEHRIRLGKLRFVSDFVISLDNL